MIYSDDDPESADWPKLTWDLPTDREEFLAFLARTGTTIAQFRTWPVYKWNVDKIDWLKEL